MLKNQIKILSVGGSIIIPKNGFDIEFLKKFRDLIIGEVKKSAKFILVIGGGATCRNYQAAASAVARNLTNEDLDWLGIKTTIFNAEFVRFLFKDLTYPEVVTNPTKKIKTFKPIIIAAGWRPGCSTDKDAVLLAKTYGAKEVINLSNIDYVYDSDPKLNPKAKKLERLSWKEFRKIVGDKWAPGANLPFDPVAAREAEKLGLTVKFAKGTDLAEVEKIISNQAFNGTVIR